MTRYLTSLRTALRLLTPRFRLFAIFFIATNLIPTSGNAQFSPQKSLFTTAPSSVVQTEQVRAELLAHAPDGVEPGKPVWVGLQLVHQPHWHTYWKNPGDSGLPTQLQWTLPAGVTAGDIAWPAPQRIAVGNLANYGFEGTLLLPVPLTIGKDFVPTATGELELRLAASWLVCSKECIPQEGNFVLRIPARGSTAAKGVEFEAARAAAPQPLGAGSAGLQLQGDAALLTVSGLPAAWQGQTLHAFPETANVFDAPFTPHSANRTQQWANGEWSARLPLSTLRDSTPAVVPVVLVLGANSLRVEAAVSGTWPALADLSSPNSAPGITPTTTATPAVSLPIAAPGTAGAAPHSLGTWALALLAALVGGLILNLMPCVLPVLAIKVLGFAQHAHPSGSAQRAQGLAYTLGVVLSFMALGALMLGLRATGEQLGWGFHLQSPAVVAGLAVLFTLIGLNLAGLFEVGNLLPQKLATLQARHPVVDAFVSGMLAVAIASPCTAPFMGASLGIAVAMPAGQALGIFAALGLGLALPFLLASWVPSVGRWLPRPGAWMHTLRQFMAFPMLATVVWLVWVLGHLTSVDGAGALLALLLGLGLLVWALGLQGRGRRVVAIISIAAYTLLASGIAPFILQTSDSTGTSAPPATGGWQPWAPGKVEAELAAGHPVFVDFTAAWCITCQYNKKTTLANTEVLQDFAQKQVTLLRADWTRRDPAITQALEQLGRSGVPVYVLYAPGKSPVVMSEILGVDEMRHALATL